MRRHYAILTALLLLGSLLPIFGDRSPAKHERKEIGPSELEQHLEDIDTELKQLAAFTLRRGVGSLGYRSKLHSYSHRTERIRIELGSRSRIDQVVLVPMLIFESQGRLQSEGFPLACTISAGTDASAHPVASFIEEDHITPRIAPLVLSFPPIEASWVSVEATMLSPRSWDDRFTLQLSEIMVFSGPDNVALQKPVTIPESPPFADASRQPKFLVDGFMPFLMDAAQGERSQTQLIKVKDTDSVPSLTIDLHAVYSINQINLHSASVGYSIPMADFSCRAVPRYIRVQGATRPDFSDASMLCEFWQQNIYDNGSIMMRRFSTIPCRYVRFDIVNINPVISSRSIPPSIAFSEIEILSEGRNVAMNAPVSTSPNLSCSPITLKRITDGLTYYGKVLPIRDWMNQLARRHDLEYKRPLVEAALADRYKAQQGRLKRLRTLFILLAFSMALSGLMTWTLHKQKIKQLKNRIAADLHDELGANLHGIGLLTNMAEEAKNNPDSLLNYLHRIQTVVQRSGMAIRHVTNLQDSSDLFTDLTGDIERAAERIVARQDHQVSITGKEHIPHLPQQTRIDLFLFYKECLINISRHSGATKLTTDLEITSKKVLLTISDNGRGLPDDQQDKIPPSVKRRAKLLRAHVQILQQEEGGTKIRLTLPVRSSFFKQKRNKNHE